MCRTVQKASRHDRMTISLLDISAELLALYSQHLPPCVVCQTGVEVVLAVGNEGRNNSRASREALEL